MTLVPVCIQQSISMEPNHVQAVHITDESEVDYYKLEKKWNKQLPQTKTGDPLEDLKQIFPETFDGKVGLFQGDVSLKLSPDANTSLTTTPFYTTEHYATVKEGA